MSDFVKLETIEDKTRETAALNRLMGVLTKKHTVSETPVQSAMDAFLTKDGVLTCAIDVKIRKPSAAKLRTYEKGLWMKHRKVAECTTLEKLLKLPMFLLYVFDNGAGEMWVCQPSQCADLIPEPPLERRNPRNLSCDKELIVYLDWSKHLERIA